MKPQRCLILILCIILAACAPQAAGDPTPMPSQPATATQPPATNTPQPSATLLPTETLIPTPTPIQICSPLEGFVLADLPAIESNPYNPPRPGMDDGHHGVDYAFYSYPALGLTQMKGLPIHSVLPGKVITASRELDPYGYIVIVETPLENLSPNLLDTLDLPQPVPLATQIAPLSCPEIPVPDDWVSAPLSLYLLYAHMDQQPAVQAGQNVACGDQLGVVGTTGSLSVNDHLHFEVRIGPSGAIFENMGHYSTAASEMERHNYCVWRISGWFQMTDPTLLLQSPIQ